MSRGPQRPARAFSPWPPALSAAPGVGNVRHYGAKGDGTTDDTAAIQAAINSGLTVYLPAATYKTSSALSVTASNTAIIGDAEWDTVLSSTSASAPVISVSTGLSYITIANLKLTRSVAPSGGTGHGLAMQGTYSNCRLENLVSEGNHNGFALGSTDYSLVNNLVALKNYSHGVFVTNNGAVACQWYVNSVLSSQNDGAGFYFVSNGAASAISVGDIVGLRTFANTSYGLAVLANSNAPIAGVRVRDCYLGEDGKTEILLDTYSSMHQIQNSFVESCGARTTGRTLSTAASDAGYGIWASQNNNDVTINGCVINGCSYSGILAENGRMLINGCRITDNGKATVAGNRNGVYQLNGNTRVMISGCAIGSTNGTSATQSYGVSAANANNVCITGCDLNGNAGATMTASAGGFTLAGNFA